jgi:hypothetical protein
MEMTTGTATPRGASAQPVRQSTEGEDGRVGSAFTA